MKSIFLYGDSNVWGDNFITGKRIPSDKQWANILGKMLKNEYIIYQQGLPGRLAGNNEIEKKFKNGKDCFISSFRTCAPVDIIIIALGTNDLNIKYNKSSKDIIDDLLWYKKIIDDQYNDLEYRQKYFNGKMPKIIYIMPPNFDYKKRAKIIFDKDSEKKRLEVINYFKNNNFSLVILNDAELFEDGIHLNYNDHLKMAYLVRGVLENEVEVRKVARIK